jgi:hypothetical protein
MKNISNERIDCLELVLQSTSGSRSRYPVDPSCIKFLQVKRSKAESELIKSIFEKAIVTV